MISFDGHVHDFPESILFNGSSIMLKRLYFGCVTLIPEFFLLGGALNVYIFYSYMYES